FYSRRIGRAPAGGVPDAAYSDVPAGTTILGAAKLSGKVSPSLNFGLLSALTREEDARLSGNADGLTRVTVEPAASFNVVRLQKDARHYFQRPDADHVRLDPTRSELTGLSSRYWLNHQNGNVILNSALGFMSPGFEINDIGFESRADVINGHLGGGYKWTNPR